jgi:hypothetical protein
MNPNPDERAQRNQWIALLIFFSDWVVFWGILTFGLRAFAPSFEPFWLSFLCKGGRFVWGGGAQFGLCVTSSGEATELPIFFIFLVNGVLAGLVSGTIYLALSGALARAAAVPQRSSGSTTPFMPVKDSGGITWEGQRYTSPDDLPPEAMAMYKFALDLFGDKDADGVPDFLQGNFLEILAGMAEFVRKVSPLGDDLRELGRMRRYNQISQEAFEEKVRELAERARSTS